MATYQSVTAGDRTYKSMSDMTPKGAITETLVWTAIAGWSWADLSDSGKTHWSDWYTQEEWTDDWVSVTKSSRTYNGVTKSDRTYTPLTTPSSTYNEVTA